MTKPLFALVSIAAALAAAAHVGGRLSGALRQVDAIAGSRPHARAASARDTAPPEATPAGVDAFPAAELEPAEVPPRDARPPLEPGLPGAAFDAQAAIHAAAERDAGIAELLSDPDPAVGAAIRDFVFNIEPPGAARDTR